MKITLIGIDLAKNIFQVCAVNQAGRAVFNRTVKRSKLLALLTQYPEVPVAMEACSGSNYWARTLEARGRTVRLIPPQHVKPFVRGNKNDRNDAFAICEAANRPNMTFVPPRTLEQTDLLLAHRLRERRIDQRTALINQLRGLLSEYGIVIPAGKFRLRETLPEVLEDSETGLTEKARLYFHEMLEEWRMLDNAIEKYDQDIKQQCRANEACVRLAGIKGVGDLTATAAVAIVGNGAQFRNGRHLSAHLGVVPREHSSGGKQRLGGITKRGNSYLRRLLVQGAWAIIRYCHRSHDRLSKWARQLIERRGKQRTALALANKLARIIWALLYKQETYQAN